MISLFKKMGLAIVIVFPDKTETDLCQMTYSGFEAFRAVVKFNETPATASLPGAKTFHGHSGSSDGVWTTEELGMVATYLEAVINDTTRTPQRSRGDIVARLEDQRARELDAFRRAVRGEAPAAGATMYPPTYPETPDDDVRSEHSGDDDDDEGPAQLAIPPSMHWCDLWDYDALLGRFADRVRDGFTRKGVAHFL